MEEKVMHLDVEELIREKLPNKKIPKFLINYLKKILHQKELNEFFVRTKGKKNLDFVECGVNDLLQASTEFEGLENLPEPGGRYIFASNHPLGGLESVVLGLMLGKKYDGKIKYFANDVLMYLEPMKDMFLPVNIVGKSSDLKKSAKVIEDFFESDEQLIIFPAGTCSRKINGVIQDLPWKKSFITKSVQYHRDVIPIYFDARNSNFFYNLNKIRTKLKLPNIEMFFLVNEMFKQRGNHFRAKIGKPIPWQTFDTSKSAQEWAAWVREKVYEMR